MSYSCSNRVATAAAAGTTSAPSNRREASATSAVGMLPTRVRSFLKEVQPIAGLLPRGHFIVPFLAPDAFKEHMSAGYGAFVPESTDELCAYLSTM